MNLQQRIEEAQKQFVDGKLPQTHVLYFEQMASLDWAGPWTDEMKSHAARCVQMWMDSHQAKQKQEAPEIKKTLAPQMTLFPPLRKDKYPKSRQKIFRLQTPEVQNAIVNSLIFYAKDYCQNQKSKLQLQKAINAHGYRHRDARAFCCINGILTYDEYDRLVKNREIPQRWRADIALG